MRGRIWRSKVLVGLGVLLIAIPSLGKELDSLVYLRKGQRAPFEGVLIDTHSLALMVARVHWLEKQLELEMSWARKREELARKQEREICALKLGAIRKQVQAVARPHQPAWWTWVAIGVGALGIGIGIGVAIQR